MTALEESGIQEKGGKGGKRVTGARWDVMMEASSRVTEERIQILGGSAQN